MTFLDVKTHILPLKIDEHVSLRSASLTTRSVKVLLFRTLVRTSLCFQVSQASVASKVVVAPSHASPLWKALLSKGAVLWWVLLRCCSLLLACLWFSANSLLWTCVSLEFLLTVAAFFVIWGLRCFVAFGLALPLLGPRLLLLCPARRALPLGFQARCPWPDPGVNFQHFLDGIFSWADREFVTAVGYVTGKVCSELEREFAKIQSHAVAKVCSEIEREFASVSGWETDREVTGEVGQDKGAAVCLPKANATARVDVPATPWL